VLVALVEYLKSMAQTAEILFFQPLPLAVVVVVVGHL
jgi:hypothetical protein